MPLVSSETRNTDTGSRTRRQRLNVISNERIVVQFPHVVQSVDLEITWRGGEGVGFKDGGLKSCRLVPLKTAVTLDSEHRAPDLTLGKEKTDWRDKEVTHGFGEELLICLRDLSLLSSRKHVRRGVHAEQILRDCDVDCEDLWRRGQGLSSSTCELSHERALSAPQPQTD